MTVCGHMPFLQPSQKSLSCSGPLFFLKGGGVAITPAHFLSLYATRSIYDSMFSLGVPSRLQALHRWLNTMALYPLREYPLIRMVTTPLPHEDFLHALLSHVNSALMQVEYSWSKSSSLLLSLNHVDVISGVTAPAIFWWSSGKAKKVLASSLCSGTGNLATFGRVAAVPRLYKVRAWALSPSTMDGKTRAEYMCLVSFDVAWQLSWLMRSNRSTWEFIGKTSESELTVGTHMEGMVIVSSGDCWCAGESPWCCLSAPLLPKERLHGSQRKVPPCLDEVFWCCWSAFWLPKVRLQDMQRFIVSSVPVSGGFVA